MFKFTTAALATGALVVLSACSQPEPIIIEPTFDKFGAATCVPDDPVPGTSYPSNLPPCEPPGDECEDQFPVGAAPVLCEPQDEGRDPSRPTRTGARRP